MLNEILEYDQYTQRIDYEKESVTYRLKYANLKQELSGIERALVIIARHEIFKKTEESEEKKEREAIEVLKAWCGFDYDTSVEQACMVKSWLPDYLELVRKEFKNSTKSNKSEGSIKNVDAALRYLKSRQEDFKKNELCIEKENGKSATEGSSENTFKEITYGKILMQAYAEGELKRYYLVCDQDLLDCYEVLKNTETRKRARLNTTGKNAGKELDEIFKATAAFLMEKGDKQKTSAFVRKTDLSNWFTGKSGYKHVNLSDYIIVHKETDEETNIFRYETISSSIVKMLVDSKWIEMFRVVCEDKLDEFLAEHRNYVYYSDFGSTEYLRKNIRYLGTAF